MPGFRKHHVTRSHFAFDYLCALRDHLKDPHEDLRQVSMTKYPSVPLSQLVTDAGDECLDDSIVSQSDLIVGCHCHYVCHHHSTHRLLSILVSLTSPLDESRRQSVTAAAKACKASKAAVVTPSKPRRFDCSTTTKPTSSPSVHCSPKPTPRPRIRFRDKDKQRQSSIQKDSLEMDGVLVVDDSTATPVAGQKLDYSGLVRILT
ncbi:unnamed protein product [Soboliphyme baturini]|uniref:Uncharacterized protein n=1 Tax=Soboliphyme baturini TaxID=241478 RepID=A0A183J229_9BILA|nr:unnamed protein product [Soboliphyme baturini]